MFNKSGSFLAFLSKFFYIFLHLRFPFAADNFESFVEKKVCSASSSRVFCEDILDLAKVATTVWVKIAVNAIITAIEQSPPFADLY